MSVPSASQSLPMGAQSQVRASLRRALLLELGAPTQDAPEQGRRVVDNVAALLENFPLGKS